MKPASLNALKANYRGMNAQADQADERDQSGGARHGVRHIIYV
jgi:hypothetical protein